MCVELKIIHKNIYHTTIILLFALWPLVIIFLHAKASVTGDRGPPIRFRPVRGWHGWMGLRLRTSGSGAPLKSLRRPGADGRRGDLRAAPKPGKGLSSRFPAFAGGSSEPSTLYRAGLKASRFRTLCGGTMETEDRLDFGHNRSCVSKEAPGKTGSSEPERADTVIAGGLG